MNNILINPATGREYDNVPVKVAAQYLDTSPQAVRDGMIEGKLPIGFVAQNAGGKPRFTIPIKRLKAYVNADDLRLDSALELLESLKTLKPA
ncbi:MAG: hypothetical protein VZQ55_06270 [Ruminococcus sp.]|nr:hypothetical protein [Ruminococcus sp.]